MFHLLDVFVVVGFVVVTLCPNREAKVSLTTYWVAGGSLPAFVGSASSSGHLLLPLLSSLFSFAVGDLLVAWFSRRYCITMTY